LALVQVQSCLARRAQRLRFPKFAPEIYELKTHVKDLRAIFFDRLFVVMINAVGGANAASYA
jgi:hypothetical protein